MIIRPDAIRGRVIAAVPTPFDFSGKVHEEGLRHLVSSLAAAGLGGVAVGTLLGRANRLTSDQSASILSTWRDGLPEGAILIASAGASPELRRPSQVFEATLAMARQAGELGTDALLVQPPGVFRGRPDRDTLILEYHLAVAEAGVPLLLSYRREVSGGIAYGPEVLAQLLARQEVLGVEIATIDGIATFQQVAALSHDLAPEKLVITAEERFLGYSLICGAEAAMVGLASAFPSIVKALLEAHTTADAESFLRLMAQVDALARPIFVPPQERSILRLLRTLVHLGVIPQDSANDPWGPGLVRSRFD